MKTFATFIVMTLVQLTSQFANAYILPLENILEKSAALAGNSILNIEQDVQYKDGPKTYTIKESWLIEGDRNLKLVAHGTGELKDILQINYLYNNKNRTFLTAPRVKQVRPASVDFFEKYLAVKSKDSYMTYLKELEIGTDVRLSRAAGLISFAIGNISTPTETSPHLWIDQNSFRLNKIRFHSHAEVEFSDYTVKDNVHYPRLKTVSWDGKTVTIKVTKIAFKPKTEIKNFYPDALELASLNNLNKIGLAGTVIDEFYSRFR